MKRRAALIAAFSAVLTLSACGGGSDDDKGSGSAPEAPKVYDAPQLVKTDTVTGSGAEAKSNSLATVNYTVWLYDSTKTDFKGTKVDGPVSTTRPLSTMFAGWQQGVIGMQVGGKRTVVIPSSQAFGAQGATGVPANSGLVIDFELTAVTPIDDAPALVKTDTVVGTGTEAVASSTVSVNYTLWLYDASKADFKGAKVEGPADITYPLSSLIEGWKQGVPGMKVGGKRTLIVPSSLGYGANSPSAAIPPNTGLVFDIELKAVK